LKSVFRFLEEATDGGPTGINDIRACHLDLRNKMRAGCTHAAIQQWVAHWYR
jgi:hypothetical protein